ncbi:hypothetical protein Cme02nite_05050 [Catellatospora methionotrophica]|uniref:Uncharacterized protein n=1 Tax=Catellatospora methionotrophica TaxID=121620 RepID=A0A8J3L0J5_9ACTN|nr:hypothetical protein [Catellatospora methionotrophica]GIG12173.1 hypothetical protein Cme02nite_05050 [Catellatospora methionotrophica]
MIRRLCHALLSSAARRWPADLRAEMLAEWRAELHALPGGGRRLRYAASLAVSRPHREAAVVVRPGRNLAHAVLSLVLLAGLPMVYLELALGWTTGYSEDTVTWQAWVGAGSILAAAGLAIICARVTPGVTQLIRPVLLPLWCFGSPYATLAAWPLLSGHLPNRSHLASGALWALSAVALGTLAARARPALVSWGIVAAAVPVSFWFLSMSVEIIAAGYVGSGPLAEYLFTLAVRTPVHVAVFLLVYANHLARRPRASAPEVAAARA